MADESRKIIVDDDWKREAQREKERLAEAEQGPAPAGGQANFVELINLLVMQAMVGLGVVTGPGGERIPPNLPAARHFIDLLALLQEKTKGNVTADEAKMLEQVVYEMRMNFVHIAGLLGAAGEAAAMGGVAAPAEDSPAPDAGEGGGPRIART